MNGRRETRTTFQDAHVRFASFVQQYRLLDERERDALLEIATIALAKLHTDRLERERREVEL